MKIKTIAMGSLAAVMLSGCQVVAVPFVAVQWAGTSTVVVPALSCEQNPSGEVVTAIEPNWAGLCGRDGRCFDPDRPTG